MPGPRDFGVQSYCFRHFKDNAQVAKMVRDIGVDKIELCGVHVQFDQPDTFDDIIATYRDAGVSIISIGVQTFKGSDNENHWFDFVNRCGATHMSANFPVDDWQQTMKTTAARAREHGVRLGIHNHGGYHWLGNEQMLEHVFRNTPDTIGLCMDTAWALDARQAPLKWADQFKQRLYGLHYKDFVFNRAGRGEDTIVGEGNLDLPALLGKLETNGFDGYAVIEYEADVENPVPALTRCVESMRRA